MSVFASSCDSGIHQVRPVQARHQDEGGDADDPDIVNAEIGRVLKEEFRAHLKGSLLIVRLESEEFLPTIMYYYYTN